MHRFNVSPGAIQEGSVRLSAQESRHALTVLRVKAGEVVELLDGRGVVRRGIVAAAEKGRVTVSVDSDGAVQAQARVMITLAASVIKPERMELLIQKACELGVNTLVPLIADRTVVRLSQERWQKKSERWRKIAAETCKQCGQAYEPQILEAVPFKKILERIPHHDLSLIPTLAVPVKRLYDSLNAHRSAQSVLVLIGPEGDFSPEEVKKAVLSGAEPVDLGPLVMRSETAALYSLSVLRYFYNI